MVILNLELCQLQIQMITNVDLLSSWPLSIYITPQLVLSLIDWSTQNGTTLFAGTSSSNPRHTHLLLVFVPCHIKGHCLTYGFLEYYFENIIFRLLNYLNVNIYNLSLNWVGHGTRLIQDVLLQRLIKTHQLFLQSCWEQSSPGCDKAMDD